MSDLIETVDTYLAMWNEPDVAKRAELIERVWTTDGRLIDPPMAAEGHDGISEMVSALQSQFPGHSFRRASGVDAHHEYVRFAWELVGPDGDVVLPGIDVGELSSDGRLRRITGFFGEVPAEESVA